MKKHIMIAAAAAVLCTGTIFAAQKLNLPGIFFSGETGTVQQEVQSIGQSVENKDYRMTLEQVLNDDNKAFVVFSIEALNEQARKPLEEDPDIFAFDHNITLNPPEGYDWGSNGWGVTGQNMEQYNQGDKKYFAWDVDFYNPEHKPLVLSLDKEHKITVPMNSDLKQVKLQVNTPVEGWASDRFDAQAPEDLRAKNRVEMVNISPLSVAVQFEKPPLGLKGYLYFEMADGRIFGGQKLLPYWNSAADNTMVAAFQQVMDLKEIKAVILGGTAYPLDGGKPYAKELPATLTPFTLEPIMLESQGNGREYANIPVEELCSHLGATLQKGKDGSITITYLGETYALHLGENAVDIPGRTVPLPVFLSVEDGKLAADGLLEWMGIDALFINQGEAGSELLDSGTWIILP